MANFYERLLSDGKKRKKRPRRTWGRRRAVAKYALDVLASLGGSLRSRDMMKKVYTKELARRGAKRSRTGKKSPSREENILFTTCTPQWVKILIGCFGTSSRGKSVFKFEVFIFSN